MKLRLPNSRTGAVLGAAAILAVATGGGAVAGSMVTGAQIKNGTIETVDLSPGAVNSSRVDDGSLRMRDFREAVQDRINAGGPQGPKGETGPAGPAGTAKYAGANWSQVDRNVIGNAFTQLRSGPVSNNFGVTVEPPVGVGSLGIHTGSGADKVAFGNQVDFVGDLVSDLNTVKFSVFTTGENRGLAQNNLPSVSLEVDPNVTDAVNYSTLVFTPLDAPANVWTELDASTAKQWYFTRRYRHRHRMQPDHVLHPRGDQGGGSDRHHPHRCRSARAVTTPSPARSTPLVINDTTYDFEPFGVSHN